ncbi:MAG: hypothetical protein K0R50_108 [Eubacterium sp.]|nr:hypothetical protein [Eubacterium sp.]
MNLELKGRLKLIADKVPECNTAADIGTDHAYLPIYLVKQGRCQRAVASDVRMGPVQVADRNITKYKLNEHIETRLGSGLETLKNGEADSIIIAGMGGTLVSELLEADTEKALSAKALILQPMNDLDIVRKWLYDHKFDIYDEELAAEGNKIYCVLAARYDGMDKKYQEFQLHVGGKLINNRDPLLLAYCEMKVRQINRVLGQLEDMEDNVRLFDYYNSLKKDYVKLISEL